MGVYDATYFLQLAFTDVVTAKEKMKQSNGVYGWMELGNAKAMAENAVDEIARMFKEKK